MQNLQSSTALQSAAFAKQMQKRSRMLHPSLKSYFFGQSEVAEVKGVDDCSSERDQVILRAKEAHSGFGERPESIQVKIGSDTNHQMLGSYIVIPDPDFTAEDNMSLLLKTSADNVALQRDIDISFSQIVADHETYHSYLRYKTYEATKHPLVESPHTQLHKDEEYSSYLHECGADLYAVFSAVRDGADPDAVIDTICALRTTNMLNKGDAIHFTTPVLENVRTQLNLRREHIQNASLEGLAQSAIDFTIGRMDNPLELTENAHISQDYYEGLKKKFGCKSMQVPDEQGKVKTVFSTPLVKTDLMRDMGIEKGEEVYLTIEQMCDACPNIPRVDQYIRPYEGVFKVQEEILEPPQQEAAHDSEMDLAYA